MAFFDPLDDFCSLRTECAKIGNMYARDPESAHRYQDGLFSDAIEWMGGNEGTNARHRARVAAILKEFTDQTEENKWYA